MLYLIRHGEEDPTVRGGWSRTALTDTGIVQAERKFPGLYYRMFAWDEAYSNGESPHAFFDRIASAWKAFKQNYENAAGDTLLVTHGGVIQIIYCLENGISYINQSVVFSAPHAVLLSVPDLT